MSNPTMLVEPFSNASGVFTVTGPERYDAGLWLEEAATNLLRQPSGTTIDAWSAPGSVGELSSVASPVRQSATAIQVERINASGNLAAQNIEFVVVTGGNPYTLIAPVHGSPGVPSVNVMLFWLDAGFGDQGSSALGVQAISSLDFTELTLTATAPALATMAVPRIRQESDGNVGDTFWLADVTLAQKDHAISPVTGAMGTGYAWTGTAYDSTSTRAVSSASIGTTDEPASVACWYREGYSGAKQFAYLDTLGQLGDYGDISYAAGDLTISTSRNLVIGPFAAFDRALTDAEQARLAATQNWSLSTVVASPYRRIRSQFQLRPY